MVRHTGDSYDDKAQRYAETIDTKPFTVFYERPAFMSLLPPLNDLHVLDVGCGTGWYAEYLVEQGAAVTAFDLNREFVALTDDRVGGRVDVRQADLADGLPFVGDGTIDLVIAPLVMHYLREWRPAFEEFRRVLKPDGMFVFSTHHPYTDLGLSKTGNYFGVELLEDEWDVGPVRFFRRPLTDMCTDLSAAGFVIERLLEPTPVAEFEVVDSATYDKLMERPMRVMIRARAE